MEAQEISSVSDDDLMLEVSRGEVRKLGLLFDRYHRKLFDFFIRMTGSREVSEDLVQDVFFRILKYRGTFRPGSRFTTWMYHIARNARIDHLHKHKREYYFEDTLLEAMSPSVAPEDLGKKQQAVMLRRALGQLPEEKREVLILSRFQNMKYDQIGEIMGCDTGTVKVRVFRAVQELRKVYFKISGEKASWNAKQ